MADSAENGPKRSSGRSRSLLSTKVQHDLPVDNRAERLNLAEPVKMPTLTPKQHEERTRERK